jgi:prepilin-type N-terminal cleavage/methylation domain-containing protein
VRRGFTLLELLVVIIIIGILASLAIPQYTVITEKSRTAEALRLLPHLAEAQQRYALRYGVYASNIANLDVELPTVTGTPLSLQNVKYFAVILVNTATPGLDNNEVVAAMCRGPICNTNELPASFHSYAVRICESGKIICNNAAGDDECERLGLGPSTTTCP